MTCVSLVTVYAYVAVTLKFVHRTSILLFFHMFLGNFILYLVVTRELTRVLSNEKIVEERRENYIHNNIVWHWHIDRKFVLQ